MDGILKQLEEVGPRPRILVVDDSPENLFAYKTTLSGNYDVVMVSSGKEALRHLLKDEFALILLDVVMPDLNGFETASLIRSRKKTCAVPLIFISAFPNDEIQTTIGYESGAVDFISTPINPEILKAKVAAFINLYNYNRARELLLQRELMLEQERKQNEVRLAAARQKADLLRRQKELEEKTNDLMAQKAIELEQFAYVASHDLKAPLRTISNFLQLLATRYKGRLDEEADQYIQFAVEGSQRLTRLVDDLLDYTRAGSTLKKTDGVNVSEVIEEVVENLKAQREESGAEITYDQFPTLSADRNHLVQLFQNLIGNAISYRSEKRPPKIHISVEATKFKGWTFAVRDNGVGFDMKHATEIFQMFKTMNSAGKGTGIGLAICKKIVEAHGGKIWVNSVIDEGTTFSFVLPDNSIQDRALEGLRVLVVDDAVDMRALAGSILKGAGVTADFAADGKEGLEKARYGLYDLVLMDVMMPKLNGMEATQALRKAGFTSPIIAFTSMGAEEKFEGVGFTDYLSKADLHSSLIPFLHRYGHRSENVVLHN